MNQNCFRFLACSLIAAIAAVAFVACHVPSGSGEPSPSTTTYTVTYNGNGNTAGIAPVDPLGYAQGSTVMVSSTLPGFAKVVSGITYTFIGWNTKANGSGTPYVAGQTFKMGNADVILYADWTTLPTNVLTFDSQGGTAVLPQNVVFRLTGNRAYRPCQKRLRPGRVVQGLGLHDAVEFRNRCAYAKHHALRRVVHHDQWPRLYAHRFWRALQRGRRQRRVRGGGYPCVLGGETRDGHRR